MLCPVCKSECGAEPICGNCGFDQFRAEFVSREDADYWMQNVVVPYREQFQSRSVISSIDWIGKLYQNKDVQYFLDITVPAAIKQNTTLGHTLLVCPNGHLVYTFVNLLVALVAPRAVLCFTHNEQQVEPPTSLGNIVRSTLIEPHENTSAMVTRITTLPQNSVFVQAGSMLPTGKEPKDALSLVLSDFYFEILIGKGPEARKIRLDTAPFTLFAFADKENEVPKHYLQYFENVIHFDLTAQELCELEAISTAIDIGYKITQTAAKEIAAHANNSTRRAAVMARHICDYLLVKEPDSKTVTDALVKTVLSQFM